LYFYLSTNVSYILGLHHRSYAVGVIRRWRTWPLQVPRYNSATFPQIFSTIVY